MTTIRCEECEHSFRASAEQEALIGEARARDMDFIMLDCPGCGLSTSYNPLERRVADDEEVGLRCPVSRCSGRVAAVDDGERPFWGCGECGSIWYDGDKLQAEITAIVAQYPYRRKAYVKRGKRWAPKAPDKEPPRYEEQVEGEPAKTSRRAVRG